MKWLIAMGGQKIELHRVEDEAINEILKPFRDHISAAFTGLQDEDISVVFTVEENRELGVILRGDTYAVNCAQDILGERSEIVSRNN